MNTSDKIGEREPAEWMILKVVSACVEADGGLPGPVETATLESEDSIGCLVAVCDQNCLISVVLKRV